MLRELKTRDIFTMSRILKKLDIKIDAKGKTQEELGANLIKGIIENLYNAEEEINDFLANLAGMEKIEFENLEIDKTMDIIKEFKELKGIKSFLSRAGTLTK